MPSPFRLPGAPSCRARSSGSTPTASPSIVADCALRLASATPDSSDNNFSDRLYLVMSVDDSLLNEARAELSGTSFFQIDKLLISLSFVEGEGRLLGTIRVDGEEFEGALLDRGWPGVEGEDVFLVERR